MINRAEFDVTTPSSFGGVKIVVHTYTYKRTEEQFIEYILFYWFTRFKYPQIYLFPFISKNSNHYQTLMYSCYDSDKINIIFLRCHENTSRNA